MMSRLLAFFGLGLASVTVPASEIDAQAPAQPARAVSFDIPAGIVGQALMKFQE